MITTGQLGTSVSSLGSIVLGARQSPVVGIGMKPMIGHAISRPIAGSATVLRPAPGIPAKTEP